MVHAFIIEPKSYTAFEDEAAQLEKCKEWSLLSDKATKTKAFFYKGNGMNLPCQIIGFVDKMTAVIEFEHNKKHCIHPSYLKEMQAANYGQKVVAAIDEAVDAVESEEVELEIVPQEAASIEVPTEAPIEEVSAQQNNTDKPIVEETPKSKAKKGKAPKLELPEEKIKMKATVKEFTTVPNNFSDNDDEVVIYEEVSILDPETVIGEAWSSHSATLKKLELEVGDTITFECKIVAKKLTKHPVAYKINNPAKIQKG
ncbi:hypothetical protein [Paenibacillus sp. N3.4]|uniref:hypothetical protein n=1 Tax=Paenibacillus sp. N3.4 TaxID=2603222 RepID=UPI0011CA8977|nr:hypothetical protein [Paenibacillus sp. N3.4]TXK84480.1 hypothetical protein FU659_08665 [Paenibacillus sp. N3.4]